MDAVQTPVVTSTRYGKILCANTAIAMGENRGRSGRKNRLIKCLYGKTQWEMNQQPKPDVTTMGVECWKVGWDNTVSGESASSSQGCTLTMTMFEGIADTTALYTWVVREGASGWWGISPAERVPWCCLWGAEYWRCQESLLSLDMNHWIGSSCEYVFLKEGGWVSAQKGKHAMTLEAQLHVTHGKRVLHIPVFQGKSL